MTTARVQRTIGGIDPVSRRPRASFAFDCLLRLLWLLPLLAIPPALTHTSALAQQASTATGTPRTTDSLVVLRIRVSSDSSRALPVEAAIVRGGPVTSQTDARGEATLRLRGGEHVVVASRVGFRPDSTVLRLRAGADTSITLILMPQALQLERVVVAATRGERRVEDTPLRVEVIDEEEIAEKVAMTPGDIAMMLNETSGLRVQATNPALGGANVRVQGLRGRYTLLLADGLPLYGGQTGGLGLLQIPPIDLARVEVIKGTASALYGSSAVGGVINLVSRQPGSERESTLLMNVTSRGGTDGVYFGSGPLAERWGYTVLTGLHLQRSHDTDDDGWTDLPGYERVVIRPRLHFDDAAGRTAFLTGGIMIEDRRGGTLHGRGIPVIGSYVESLDTRRADVGGRMRWEFGGDDDRRTILTIRGSATEQRHEHRFGDVFEADRHHTRFVETAFTMPRCDAGVPATWILGGALHQDTYRNSDVDGFDFSHTIPAIFLQLDADPAGWISLSSSARMDAHSVYGTFVNPRVSVLLRPGGWSELSNWSLRLSAGSGTFTPTPFTEETEATGLTPIVLPESGVRALAAERVRSGSVDLGGAMQTMLGRIELNGTVFGSRTSSAIQVREAEGTTSGGVPAVTLFNAAEPTRTWGGELLVRAVRELGGGNDAREGSSTGDEHDDTEHADEPPTLRLTASYTYLRSVECDAPAPGTECPRREVPLTPRHSLGMVASVEQHDRGRIGLEVYYTGRQMLERNPYRSVSRPYLIIGMLGERTVHTRAGEARVFLNLENITNVRQTRYEPLLLPARGPGGRWTTDAWTDLAGFTVNGGVRLTF